MTKEEATLVTEYISALDHLAERYAERHGAEVACGGPDGEWYEEAYLAETDARAELGAVFDRLPDELKEAIDTLNQ